MREDEFHRTIHRIESDLQSLRSVLGALKKTIGGHGLPVGAVRPKDASPCGKTDQREGFPQDGSVNGNPEPTKQP
jgi:hypothetical protein